MNEREWQATLEIVFPHGFVRSDGERLQIELREAAFRYEVLEALGEPAALLQQLDLLSTTSGTNARWLDLDAACRAWQRGRLGAGKLGLAAAEEVARRGGSGGSPVQSSPPANFAPTHRVDLHDATGRWIAEVLSDGSGGYWRAIEPTPELVRQLVELFARPRSRLGAGGETEDGMMADAWVELPPWELPTLVDVVTVFSAEFPETKGPIVSATLIELAREQEG